MPRLGRSPRRFTLADLMVLVAATGAALAMLRLYLRALSRTGTIQWGSGALRTIEITYGMWSIVAFWWMIALLFSQYRGPHPSRARLVRRPGHVACSVAMVALIVGFVHEAFHLAGRQPDAMPFSFYQLWITVSVRIGPMIAGAWLVLALSGRWRADPGWIDRLGRLLGCCWIGWMLFWVVPWTIRQKIPPIWDGVLP